MRIANPIYDVVFKDLRDDDKVARLVLSALRVLAEPGGATGRTPER